MKQLRSLSTFVFCFHLACVQAQVTEAAPTEKPVHVIPGITRMPTTAGIPTLDSTPVSASTGSSADASGQIVEITPTTFSVSSLGTGINYHDGAVMEGNNQNVYFIWYGNWGMNTAQTILPRFIANLQGSPYFNTNASYFDNFMHIRNTPVMSTQVWDAGSQGNNLTDQAVFNIVNQALTNQQLAYDPNGIYLVLSAPDVTASNASGTFCGQNNSIWCGWHSFGTFASTTLRYGLIGNPATQCPATMQYYCSHQSTTPNNNEGADAMTSVIAHEINETVTDPNGDGWYGSSAQNDEVGDKCNFNFGATYSTANGSQANVRLNGTDYLIQQNWVNTGTGSCAMSYQPVTGLCYQAHVENIGWMAQVCDGDVAGTVHRGLKMEAITITAPPGYSVCYNAYLENVGWQGTRCNGAIAGTTGQNRRMEALQVWLAAGPGHVEYFGQVENLFWMGPSRDGQQIGTTGQSLRLEAVVLRLLP